MRTWMHLVLGHRALVLLILAAITAGAGVVCSDAVIASSLGKLFLGDSPAFARYQTQVRRFGSDELILIGIDEPDPLGPASLERLRDAVDRVLEIEEVMRVDSVLGAQRIQGIEGGVKIRRWSDLAEEAPASRGPLVEALRKDDAAAGLVIGEDGRKLGVIVELVADTDRPAEQGPALVAAVERAFVEAGYRAAAVHRDGMLPVLAEVMRESVDVLLRLFPFVVLVLLATVLALFRGLLPVVVTMGVTLVAVVWTFALSVWMDPQVSILQTIVPAVVLIVGFSDVIHLYSAYLLELQAGLPKREAIVESGAEVGRACLFTSMTTFIGFVSLSMVPTPAFRHLGVVLGFGVAVALALAVTATPVILDLLPEPEPADSAAARRAHWLVDRIVDGSHRLSTTWPRAVVAVFALVGLAAGVGVAGIEVETDMVQRLPEGGRARQDADWFRDGFAGSATLEVYVDAGEKGGALDPELIAGLDRFERAAEQVAGVDQVGSLVDVLGRLHKALGGEGRLPTTRQGVAQELLLFEMKGGRDLDRVVDFDRRHLRVGVRLRPTGIRAAHRIAEELRTLSAQHIGDRAEVEVTGMNVLLGAWLGDILRGQLRGLALSILSIALMMIWVVGSWRVGLWSMVPNLLPLWLLGGWVGGLWPTVDSDTFAIAMLAVGIGVDDTIHFMSRYRLESQRGVGDAEALRRTFHFAGRAIVMTTIILVLGHLPLGVSDYFSVHIMGTLLPMCLASALVADLLLVPALVTLGWMSLEPPAQGAPVG